MSLFASGGSASAPESDSDRIQAQVLTSLHLQGEIADSNVFAQDNNFDHQTVVGALKSLLVDRYAVDEKLEKFNWYATEEGEGIKANGSPEFRVYNAVPVGATGILQSAMNAILREGGVSDAEIKNGLGSCMKNKWIKQEKTDIEIPKVEGAKKTEFEVRVTRVKEDVTDETQAQLRNLQSLDEKTCEDLKRRKLAEKKKTVSWRITKGENFRPVRVKKFADLTKDMLGEKKDMAAGSHWSDLEFKTVNLEAMGAAPEGGSFHPLLKVRTEFRRILMEMGFEEMPTNKWVESSFWNFDALFQPQSHPARDAHDTFFIKKPLETRIIPEDYYQVVKNTHETGGGFGSIGYGTKFKRADATTNLLRTHTTAISAQMLYKMAKEMETTGVFTPKKFFSIDRVFRNEAMDATHLCEFHQVEGLIADRNLTLGNLRGTIKTFFEKIGITELRFKPAYNPYTEPSMEIFGYHPELKKWCELGNSGMFRPEMLRPMGFPEDVRVIAWGLSLERPTMIKYHIENIRDLFGHKADLQKQRTAPIARYDVV